MSKIRIKNFGPIKEGYLENDGWIDIKKVTVFIGNQGSGKSTVAKVFSSLTWLEKALNRGDVEKGQLSQAFFYDIFNYQRIRNYFEEDSEIEYQGDFANIKYNKKAKWTLNNINGTHKLQVPKIMYVPAERNFLSTIKNAFGIKNLPDTLYTFAEELRKGQHALNDKILPLPIGGINFKFKKESETSFLSGKNFELDILESSSGFQSLVPLYLVSKFLSEELMQGKKVLRNQLSVEQSVRRNKEIADLMFDTVLPEKEKKKRVKAIDARYLNTCFINIVEEPEQNLFPSSQRQILNNLLGFNNMIQGNKLIMTTHSPYIINYLSIAVQGQSLSKKINSSNGAKVTAAKFDLNDYLLDKLYRIIPKNSLISSSDLVIYELDEENGSINKLSNQEGVPSDKNYLNQSIATGNKLFDELLEIEEEL
ncbi:MAG: ATP-binding protein [Bacteroidota bacterium]